MNIQFLKEVTDILAPVLTENGFTAANELGTFKGEYKTYRVSYNEDKKLFEVAVAPAESESFTSLSNWYFDENDHGPKDTLCIGEDFLTAVAKDAGIKVITQKFLAMFPQYKDTYKAEVAKYGDFMYVDFFKKYGIEKMRELMADETANKKQLTKYWNMLGDMHYEGELVVADLICTVILAGSFGNEPEKYDEAAEKYLNDYPFLKASGKASVHDYKHNKKLRKLIEG